MPKNSTQIEFKNFIKGLVDVASPLNFPDNASFDEENFELNRDGTRNRRLGFDVESGAVYYNLLNSTYLNSFDPVIFKWKDAAGQVDKDFLIVQDGNTLHIFDLINRQLSINGFVSSIELTDFPPNSAYSFASVDGRLVVACGEPSVALITFVDPGFDIEYIRLKTRDLWGIPTNDQYDTDESFRGALNARHNYNLQNQSWGIPRRNRFGQLIDPVAFYIQSLRVAPSNSEVVWTGLQFQAVGSGNEPFERLWPNMWEEALGANVKSSKGYFIIDVVDRGRSRAEQFANNWTKYPQLTYSSIDLEADRTPGGPSFVKEFAGRIFYAGFQGKVIDPNSRSPNLSNYVFFSQLVKSKADYAKCYQAGDPTSRESSDIVDTDGGFIRISGAEQIIALETIGNSLIVLATNGVWAIVGGSDYGFTATNFRVDKITSFGCVSAKSVVSDGGKVFYWSDTGIYLIMQGEVGGMTASNITENTIQNLYDDIDNSVKQKATAVYDTLTKKIKWLYRTGDYFDPDTEMYEIILDTTIGSFYKFKIYNTENNEYGIVQGFDTNRFELDEIDSLVLVDSDGVVSNTDPVVISDLLKTGAIRNTRYLVLKNTDTGVKFTFGYYYNNSFRDWDEIDASAYLITGDITTGNIAIKKQIPYIFIAMARTEVGTDGSGNLLGTSSCIFTTQWDWSTSSAANRWSNPQQAYRLKRVLLNDVSQNADISGTRLVVTKNKARGSGRSFAIKFEAEPLKDCKLVGWNLSLNGTSTP